MMRMITLNAVILISGLLIGCRPTAPATASTGSAARPAPTTVPADSGASSAATVALDKNTPPLTLNSFIEPKRPEQPKPTVAPRQAPAEFFVDGNSPAADDNGPGSADKPYKTINRGVTELHPGDTLTIRTGEYRECVRVRTIGDEQHPVTIRAADGATVVIKGSEVIKGWVKEGDVWKREGFTGEYVQKNFKDADPAEACPRQVYQKDGLRGEAVVLTCVRTPEELRAGKCYYDRKTGMLTIFPAQGTAAAYDPNINGVEIPVRHSGLSVEGAYITARGLQVRQIVGGNGVGGWKNKIEDCLFSWSSNNGLHVTGIGTEVRRVECCYCGCTGMGGIGLEMLIEDCVLTNNNVWRDNPGWHGGGAKFIPGFSKSIIRRCRFERNYGPGLWFDASCNDNIVENNICSYNEGCGIAMEISRGNILRNNICNYNTAATAGMDIVPNDSAKGINNMHPVVAEQLRQDPHSGGAGIVISSSPYSKVYNNLCMGNGAIGIDVEGGRRGSDDIIDYAKGDRKEVQVSTHDVDIRNNILINNGMHQLRVARANRDADTFNIHSDYNMFYSPEDRPIVLWGFGGTEFVTLEQWQKESRNDEHSLIGSPIFEFAAGLDYRLQPDSLGVDQGQSLKNVPVDCLGVKRPDSKSDMGPYEIASMKRTLVRPAVPQNLSYTAIDLGKFINRTFADTKAADGVGGWTDQGPDCDVRNFPTGKQTFNGVTFDINPKGCVVLSGNPWSKKVEKLPLKVTIPVHRKADVLVFLHSGAWVWEGRTDWRYIIHRGDGTQEEIKMVGGDNIRDWANPNPNLPFYREFPTYTKVAWTGSCKTFPKASVYMMTWVNKNSAWCDVTEVEFISEDCSVPVLVGISAGVKK